MHGIKNAGSEQLRDFYNPDSIAKIICINSEAEG